MTLAVLSEMIYSGERLPAWGMALLVCFVCLLMVSRIVFPSFAGIFSQRRRGLALALLFAASLLLIPALQAWLFFTFAYIGVSLALAGHRLLQKA